jgi:TolB-like protein
MEKQESKVRFPTFPQPLRLRTITTYEIRILRARSTLLGQDMRPISSALAAKIASSGKRTVAVVDFTDLQGCVTELGRYMAEDVSVAILDNAKGFDVIDRTNLKILMDEHKLTSTGIIDPATARKLGEVAGVDALVTGTIAPLSDSIHVSAKVLDTESAKMLAGVTADIPRTRAVEELLAKGVSNCGQGPTRNPDNVQLSGGVSSPSKAAAVGQIGSIQISITTCQREGDSVRCFGKILNHDRATTYVGFAPLNTHMIDNQGSESKYVRYQVGSGGWEHI